MKLKLSEVLKSMPSTEEELERLLNTVQGMIDSEQWEAALGICEQLINYLPTRAAGLRTRADVYRSMSAYKLELADLELLTTLDTLEPSDFFDYGVVLRKLGYLVEAISAFKKAISLGEQSGFSYYTNTCCMHLVEILIKLNHYEQAISECKFIPNNYSTYFEGNSCTSKEDLLKRIG